MKRKLLLFTLYLFAFSFCPLSLQAQNMQELKHAAELGNVEAMFTIGNCYFHGNGVNRDYGEAETWYGRATAQWYALAKKEYEKLNLKSEASYNGNWSQFLNCHLKYPAKAIVEEVQGIVMLEFTVLFNEFISDIKVLRSLSKECDNEAMRVVRTARWKPAVNNKNENVSTRILVPVSFRLQ